MGHWNIQTLTATFRLFCLLIYYFMYCSLHSSWVLKICLCIHFVVYCQRTYFLVCICSLLYFSYFFVLMFCVFGFPGFDPVPCSHRLPIFGFTLLLDFSCMTRLNCDYIPACPFYNKFTIFTLTLVTLASFPHSPTTDHNTNCVWVQTQINK